MLGIRGWRFSLLEGSRSSKAEAMLPGSNDLSTVLEHKDKLKRNECADLTHVRKIHDAVAPGAKE